MTTIINTPANGSGSSDGGAGAIVGLLLAVVLAVLFFIYGLPLIRRAATPAQINVPDKIDVNVQTPNNGGVQ